jgi:DNA-binding beta-propeller fold protein YncE
MHCRSAPISRFRRSPVLPLIYALSAACGSDDPSGPSPSAGTLTVSPASLVMGLGMSRRLSVSVLDAAGSAVPDASVSFRSDDATRAAVAADGEVSYVGAGPATITASSGGLSASVPYRGIRSGHPLGTQATSVNLPGMLEGDAPFGVAVDGEGRILISQTATGRIIADVYPVTTLDTRSVGGTPASIVPLAGGKALVTPTGPENTDASLVDLTSAQPPVQVPLGVAAFSVASAPDSLTAYLGTNDGRVLVFDVGSAQVTAEIDLEVEKSRANHLAINPAGTMLYASSFTTGTISEVDLASRTVRRVFVVGGEPQGAAVSLDGTELFLADEAEAGFIKVFDLVNPALLASLPSGATTSVGGAFALAMSPDGAVVYAGVITGDGPGLILVVDVATRTVERTITSCGETPRRIGFGYSGGLAVIADETGCVNFVE